MKRFVTLLLLTCLFSVSAHSKTEGYLYLEGVVTKVDRAWSNNPITGFPMRVTPAIWVKVSKVSGVKKTPIEDDTWDSEYGGTVIGKGFSLDPVADNQVANQVLQKVLKDMRSSGDEAQRIHYFGSEDAAKFMLKGTKIWNKWKGPIAFRGVVDVQTWESQGKENLAVHIRAAEIRQGKRLHRERNYREFWTKTSGQELKFQELHGN